MLPLPSMDYQSFDEDDLSLLGMNRVEDTEQMDTEDTQDQDTQYEDKQDLDTQD